MASTVSTELPPLQSRDVDFVGSRPSPGRRSSVAGDDDNQSDGTVSEVDPTEDDVGPAPQSSAGNSEATAVSRGRVLGVSQYHSISELSSPSAAASTATTMAGFCVQPSSSSTFDFSAAQQLYGADSVHVLRGIFHAGHRRNGDVSDDEEWASTDPRDRMSGDEEDLSPRHSSVNVSMSSVDELSGDDEAHHGPHDLRTKPPATGEAADGNGAVPSSSGSDSGSAGDDVVEAKRARMESIVTNMRPSLQPASGTTANGTAGNEIGDRALFGGKEDDPKRRPKRKQYIPKQHDTSSGMESPGKPQQPDSGEESGNFGDRKPLLSAAEKMALDAELRGVNEQLNYIRRKYAHLFDDAQQMPATAGYFTAAKNVNEFGGRAGKWRENSWSQAFHDAFSKRASSEWKKFTTDAGFTSCVPKHENDVRERYVAAMQSSPLAGDTPVDVRRVADMLKAEITERVESLVNEIIRNFVDKYGLAEDDRSSPETAVNESTFKPEPREKLPEVAVTHADDVTSGSYVEDLSPGRDADDADRATTTTSAAAASFLSVPSLLLPTPRRPTTTVTISAEDSTAAGTARSLSDDDAPTTEDHQSHSSPDVPLSSSDQTAFEIPPRTAHHPLYSLFASHAPYYPNASRMAAAAAAAAAAVAANGAYPPPVAPPPVGSSLLFPVPHCREPEQTEALPLVVNTPTKKKRTKVTDTRLSPRAARSILHDAGHRHHHTGSYHHHPHARQDSSHHRGVHYGAPRVTDDAPSDAAAGAERRRPSPVRSSADGAASLVSPFLQSRHPAAGTLPPLSLLPASLPTSVAVPNPSLQHSDIMSAIFQFSQQRVQQHQHQQQPQIDSTQQRFAPTLQQSPFVDKFDFKSLAGSDTQTSAGDGLRASLPSARKAAAESNGTDAYESLFHEDGLVSFTLCLVNLMTFI